MQLNIEEQIPIKSKVFRNYFVLIPKDVRRYLNFNIGDNIEVFSTTKGIFIRKEGETNE